jgi:outer membrane protein TolC
MQTKQTLSPGRAVLFGMSVSILVGPAFSSGCGLNRQGDREVSELLGRYEHQRTRQAHQYGSLRRHDSVTTARSEAGRESLDEEPMLAQLIDEALDRNPDIQAATETARSKASVIPQVTSLPDPFVSTKTLPEPVRTAEGDNYLVFGMKQMLPVPEKLDRRGRIALEETRMAMEQLRQTRLRVIADVKRAYFSLFAIDKMIGITKENERLLRDLIEVARGQFQVGRRQQADVLRAQVEFSSLETRLVQLAQQRTTAESLLNSLLDRPHTTSIESPPDFDVRKIDVRLDQLLSRALIENPELRRLKRQVARDQQAARLARLAYWPDFTLGFEWMQMDPRGAFKPRINPATGVRPAAPQISEDGSDNWAITFGLNVPLWIERIEAGIREAEQTLSASRRRQVSVRNTVTFKVQDALARVRSLRDIANLYATSIVPQAQQAYEVSREAYIAGTSDFQYVIDNWQKWLFFRIEYYRTLGDLERSVADLEQAVGISIVEAGT